MSRESGHREVDHTADVAFECWGEDLAALFAEATLALAELCFDPSAVAEEETRGVDVEGEDREELLVHWLQEVYLLLELDGWLWAGVRDLEVGDGSVSGTLAGEPRDDDRHTLHTEIKAITYHGLDVARDESGLWRATVVIDV